MDPGDRDDRSPPGDLPRKVDPEAFGPRYEVLDLLGRGGMGEVWRVRDRALNRVVALKAIRSDAPDRSALVDRFFEEAQATAQLEHPGILPVYHSGTLPDGRLYYTTPEVRGRTLREVVHAIHGGVRTGDEPAWTMLRAVDVVRDAAEAVGYAHSRGVIHRDLKPGNILVGDHGEVLVVDWGLVKVLKDPPRAPDSDPGSGPTISTRRSGSDIHETLQGTIAGTFGFMAPEQLQGQIAALSPATDCFALGVVLFYVLAGRVPGVGEGNLGLEGSRADESIAESLPDGSNDPALVALCRAAMQYDPARRPENGQVFAARLGAWLEGARAERRTAARVLAADVALEELSIQQRAVARQLLLRTVRSDGRPEEVPFTDLRGADPTPGSGVASALLDLGLVQGPPETLRLDPELLPPRWPRLVDWLETDGSFEPLRHRLSVAARDWHATGRSRSRAWRADDVSALREWLTTSPLLTPTERAFTDQSLAIVRSEQRAKTLALWAVIVFLVAW